MVQRSNYLKYRRRQLVEITFSVLKIRYGGDLKTRKFPVQIKEIVSKMIVCNIHKVLLVLINEIFYRAIISKISNETNHKERISIVAHKIFISDSQEILEELS